MPNRYFSEEYWEHLWLVNIIMTYKLTLESEQRVASSKDIEDKIKSTNAHMESLEEKLDLIISHLNIDKE